MITLYQFHWSHFVEKVRWALDYKGLQWSAVDVDPFTLRQMRHLRCPLTLESGRKLYTVPVISDAATGVVLADSSRILDYLETTYPTPALYPADPDERAEMTRWMLWLDSTLGLTGRRLGYTQIALEHPEILSGLFIPHLVGARGLGAFKSRLGGVVIAGVLSRRFRFRCNRVDRVFEQLEQCLLRVAQRLSAHPYLVGERFTAADLTLAALLRPAMLVPFFRDHPGLQGLWQWRLQQLHEHQRETHVGYEKAMDAARRRRGWALGHVKWLTGPSQAGVPAEIPSITVAQNDQQSMGRWPLLKSPYWYLRLAATCGLGRTAYT